MPADYRSAYGRLKYGEESLYGVNYATDTGVNRPNPLSGPARPGSWARYGDMDGGDVGRVFPLAKPPGNSTQVMLRQLGKIPVYTPPSRRPRRARALHRQLQTR